MYLGRYFIWIFLFLSREYFFSRFWNREKERGARTKSSVLILGLKPTTGAFQILILSMLLINRFVNFRDKGWET